MRGTGGTLRKQDNGWEITFGGRRQLVREKFYGTFEDASARRDALRAELGLSSPCDLVPPPSEPFADLRPPMSWEYIAGLFDGEGCITSVHRNGANCAPVVRWSVAQKNLNGLDEVIAFLRERCTPYLDHSLSVSLGRREDVLLVLRETIPFLRIKREIAVDHYNYLREVSILVATYGVKYGSHVERPRLPLRSNERKLASQTSGLDAVKGVSRQDGE